MEHIIIKGTNSYKGKTILRKKEIIWQWMMVVLDEKFYKTYEGRSPNKVKKNY